jgi:hypothetical protein
VHIGALPDHGEEEGAAFPAPCVVQRLLSDDQELVRAVRELELLPLDAGKRLERGPGGRATTGAVTVHRVQELVGDSVPNVAALATPDKQAVVRCALGRHLAKLLVS